ncbi:hypothetical protein NLI96_g3395 [Meripilus lineatus]|uniref:non-specific serine/threonine protein kinase n=1 Tax=Meripilus lineatus TaxID=2056292 RepID=A0AAD5YFP7_9APHY|nr:hypothetical protein NLI96_g3395 [Physisporinus lineatus]
MVSQGATPAEVNTHIPVDLSNEPAQVPGAATQSHIPIPDEHPIAIFVSDSHTPSTPAVAVPPSPPPLSLFDFAVTKELGAGAFGTVYLTRHRTSDTRTALKVIKKHPDDDHIPERALCTQVLEEKFARGPGDKTWGITRLVLDEFVALQRVRGKANMLQILGAFHDKRNWCIATTYHAHGDLEKALKTVRRFPTELVKFFAADMLCALETLREVGIVHRDLKPANILFADDGHITLADFGLARCFETHMTDIEKAFFPPEQVDSLMRGAKECTRGMCGTPEYVAPEIYRKEHYSYPADVWSVGVILYRMLVGGSPWDPHLYKYEYKMGEIVKNEPVAINKYVREAIKLDPKAEDFVLSILDKNPVTRPTPAKLKAHPWFKKFDWVKHARSSPPKGWMPTTNSYRVPISSRRPFIRGGPPLLSKEDPFPLFTFASPPLTNTSFIIPPTPTPTPSSPSPSPNLLSPTVEPVWVPTTMSTLVGSSSPNTLVGFSSPLSQTSPISNTPSGARSFHKFKKWIRDIFKSRRSLL